MIAKIKIGKNFVGALEYNINKLKDSDRSKRADVLETNFQVLTIDAVKKELSIIEQFNPRLERTTFHTSLNFSTEEIISNEKMLQISKEYMQRMGFDDNLYAIIRHNDTDHPHSHILCHRTKFNGKTVSDSNSYHKSNEILRELEVKYDVKQVVSIYETKNLNVTKNEIEFMLRTGQPTEKMKLKEIVGGVLPKSKDIVDFTNRLQQSEIRLFFKQDHKGNPTGLLFLNKDNVLFSASKLSKDFSLGHVLKSFGLIDHPKLPAFADFLNNKTNDYLRSRGLKPLMSSNDNDVRKTLGEVIKTAVSSCKTVGQFVDILEKRNLHCLFNVASTGKITGLSIIYDGKAYKSSDIHREFSSNKILNKINYEQIRDSKAISQANTRTRERFGTEIPNGSFATIRNTAKKSKGNLQSYQEGIRKNRSVQEQNTGRKPEYAKSDINDSNKTETTGKKVADFISSTSSIFNSSYSHDGLNTKRNDKKCKNKPSL